MIVLTQEDAMRAEEFINQLRSHGQYSFTSQEAKHALGLKKIASLNALKRLQDNKNIVSPARGFYLIVPPEYQAYGCLPADMFISNLMEYFNKPYYVSFLSAAQYYGAAHQKPQVFQVVTSINRRPIHCGRIYINFIANKNITKLPLETINSYSGLVKIASPEVLSYDIVTMPQHAAGISNAATVLLELAEKINIKKLICLTTIIPEFFWLQRLGYILEFLGFNYIADEVYKLLNKKKLHWVRLVAHAPYASLLRDKKWRIIVNTNLEPDE